MSEDNQEVQQEGGSEKSFMDKLRESSIAKAAFGLAAAVGIAAGAARMGGDDDAPVRDESAEASQNSKTSQDNDKHTEEKHCVTQEEQDRVFERVKEKIRAGEYPEIDPKDADKVQPALIVCGEEMGALTPTAAPAQETPSNISR